MRRLNQHLLQLLPILVQPQYRHLLYSRLVFDLGHVVDVHLEEGQLLVSVLCGDAVEVVCCSSGADVVVGVKVNDNGFVRFDGVAEVLDSVEGERGF